MMTHIDEGRLQALIDGELRLDDRHRVERHLASCDSCRVELEGLRSLSAGFTAAMAELPRMDRSRPHAAGGPVRSRSATMRAMLPRAAVFLLFVGAAASATIPGSPVRRWLGMEPASTTVADAERAVSVQEVPAASAESEALEAGVSVEAADGSVEIVLRGAGADLRVRAMLVDGTRAGVYAAGEAASSRFLTGAGRIEVLNARAGELRIELPRDVAIATVVVNGREYLRKQDGRLDLRVGEPDGAADGIEFSVQP
jgi:hypothetical protein